MEKIRKKAFTLMELLVVIIIIGVLAGIMFPGYQRAKERAIDRQAKTILPLIRAAQREYSTELGGYFPGSGTITNVIDINNNLNIDISDDGTWDSYCVTSASGFTASMHRDRGGFDRSWTIDANSINATCYSAAGCP